MVGHTYRIFNRRTIIAEESIHVSFDKLIRLIESKDEKLVPRLEDRSHNLFSICRMQSPNLEI